MFDIVVIAQIAAVIVLFLVLLYILGRKPSRMQTQTIILTVSTIIMMAGYLLELFATNEESAMFGALFAYIGKPFTLLSTTLFIANYAGVKVSRRTVNILAVLHGLITLFVCTTPLHHLYYASWSFDASLGFSKLVIERGPLYLVYVIISASHLLVDLIITIREFRRCRTRADRSQILFLLAMLISGLGGYGIYLSGITGGYDTTMAGCVLGTFFLSILFFRYRLFDVLTLAKEQALQDSPSGLLVLDQRDQTVYENLQMTKLLAGPIKLDEMADLTEGENVLHRGGRVYSAHRHTIVDKGRVFGETIEVSDITDSYNYAARLERDVADRTQEIQEIQRRIVSGFANIVEARNGETGLHVKRTSWFVKNIAQSLAERNCYVDTITPEYIECLVDVAPLHDVGKISVPDHILLKPGRLTPEEFDIIKTHSASGAKILENTLRGVEVDSYVDMAEDVAHYHHERWDGKGYPCGLAEDAIPLAARIMAVADVYDALRSERCYKPPFDHETAIAEITKGRGTQFDPQVVDAFIACIDKIEQI